MDITNLNDIELNQLEYCTVAEKTYLPAETVKVIIPKLNVNTKRLKKGYPKVLIQAQTTANTPISR